MDNRMTLALPGSPFYKVILLPFSVAFLSALVVLPTHAAIALDRTRVIFDGELNSVSLKISNQNKQLPYLAQGWIEDEKGNKITSPFTILPPVQRIEPGKPSQIKIQALPSVKLLKQDRETIYYFNLREIPPKSSKPNTLQIALQTRIKMFYRPTGIAIDRRNQQPQEMLTLTRQGDKFTVNNPTPYYVTILDASTDKSREGVKNFKPVMVSPKESLDLGVSAASLGSHPVLTYINDFGGRPQLIFDCSSANCTVVPDRKK